MNRYFEERVFFKLFGKTIVETIYIYIYIYVNLTYGLMTTDCKFYYNLHSQGSEDEYVKVISEGHSFKG